MISMWRNIVAIFWKETKTYFTSPMAYIIAGVWCIFDEKAQCLWDKIGRSYVVNKDVISPVSTTQIIDQQKTREIAIEKSPLHGRSQIADDLREIDLLLEQGVINEKEHSKRRHERIHGKS